MAMKLLVEGALFPHEGKQIHRSFGQQTGRSEFEEMIATLKGKEYIALHADTRETSILNEYGVELDQPIFVTPLTNRDQVVYNTKRPQVYLRVDTGHFYNNEVLVEWVPYLLSNENLSRDAAAYLIAISQAASLEIEKQLSDFQ